ncbi:MAG: biopolymer transporter ExbD [Prevotellaceae bacterium]|nr:biopolymer transporter ExbD [Prevotellaceae bacterium]MCD8304210.1 biopolymer transporter ExbD [Prevotellaceae bacterium]
MAKAKKKVPGLNTSSTADISFMLLIFFLITTSMDTDMGLSRRLPQPPQDEDVKEEMKIKDRNVMEVRVNAQGFLWVKDGTASGFAEIKDLRSRAKAFIKNEANNPKLPELHPKNIEGIGMVAITDKHVISVQTDRGTPYEIYFLVQDELVAAYNELRDDAAKRYFHHTYAALNDEQQSAIRQYYPQRISEAEPKNYGGAN